MNRRIFAVMIFAMSGIVSLNDQRLLQAQQQIRAGMIGLDTSHVPAFTRIFNSSKDNSDLAGIKIVVGYPGGTDIPASKDRVGKFTDQVRDMGLEIVDTIPRLLEKVDVVLIESVDGRIHLEEAVPVIKAGKPLWIDKPVAGSLADAIVIYELAKKRNVPVFSASSLRFNPGLKAVLNDEKIGPVAGSHLGFLLVFARHARHVFLRHTRHRAAVRPDGNRMRNGQPRTNGRHRLCHGCLERRTHRHVSRHQEKCGRARRDGLWSQRNCRGSQGR